MFPDTDFLVRTAFSQVAAACCTAGRGRNASEGFVRPRLNFVWQSHFLTISIFSARLNFRLKDTSSDWWSQFLFGSKFVCLSVSIFVWQSQFFVWQSQLLSVFSHSLNFWLYRLDIYNFCPSVSNFSCYSDCLNCCLTFFSSIFVRLSRILSWQASSLHFTATRKS